MSVIRRAIRRFRQDASYDIPPNWNTTFSRNQPPTFTPYLIRQKVDNVEDLSHLGMVSRNDPLGYAITYGHANEAMGDWFVIVDDKGEETSRNKRIQYELRLLQAKEVYIQALAYELAYGYSYVYTGKNKYVPQTPEGGKLASLHAFTPEECVVKHYDAVGEPVLMEVTVNVGEGEYTTREKKIPLPAEDFQFINTRPIGRGYQGKSKLEGCWDDLTRARLIMDAMTHFDIKHGRGMFTARTKTGLPDELVAKYNTELEAMSARRSLVVDGNKMEELKWIGPTSTASDFDAHLDACVTRIAAATRIPKDRLIGATGGTNEAALTAEKTGHKLLSETRVDMEPYLTDLIRRMGYPMDDFYEWNARYAHDEEERSKIGYNEAMTNVQKLNYMTIDEVREEQGLPPLPDGRGDKVAGEVTSFQMDIQGLPQEPGQGDQTRNQTGAQV